MMPRETAVEFDAAVFAYTARPVLDGVDLRLDRGSLHFLTGRSGAGKTTLMRLISGELVAQSGRVEVLGRNMTRITRRDLPVLRRRLGLVRQGHDLLDHLTLFDNIALPLIVQGIKPETRRADIEGLATWVGLDDRLTAKPPALSSGERQRAAMARALIAAPDILLADEPTGDVDEEAGARILDLLLELSAAGRTVLVATHDLALVRKAQGRSQARTLRLDRGKILRAGASL